MIALTVGIAIAALVLAGHLWDRCTLAEREAEWQATQCQESRRAYAALNKDYEKLGDDHLALRGAHDRLRAKLGSRVTWSSRGDKVVAIGRLRGPKEGA